MDETTVTKRADELQVGDRIAPRYLTFAMSPGEVLLAVAYEYLGQPWVFAAYRLESGLHDGVNYLPHAVIEAIPAPDRTGLNYTRADDEPDDPAPVSPARVPLHTGGMTEGGLVDETGGYWDPSVTSVPVAGPVHMDLTSGESMCGLAPTIAHKASLVWREVTCQDCKATS